jgi:site-specific recombinase XerD
MDSWLSQWITDYLRSMVDEGYSPYTVEGHQRMLSRFEGFVAQKGAFADQAFSRDFLDLFFTHCRLARARAAINGFIRYLAKVGLASSKGAASSDLPELFASYLHYHHRTREAGPKTRMNIRKVLRDFSVFLNDEQIRIEELKIGDVDRFLREAGRDLSVKTRQDKRSILRGFLRYSHHERRLFKKDLAAQLKSAPVFNRDNPPKYLRPDEIKRLFDSAPFSSPSELRANAMAHLAYTTGLRPSEIARISLDDISFKDVQLRVPLRKGCNPAVFPLPEETIKAVAAYIIGARPQNNERALFLGLDPPHAPIGSPVVQGSIARLMKRASVPGKPYWLRHTYAQNLLECGASIFEIKEMLGHDSIKSTKRYLHIDIRLMREVLLDE